MRDPLLSLFDDTDFENLEAIAEQCYVGVPLSEFGNYAFIPQGLFAAKTALRRRRQSQENKQ